jgi:hypothetical protein
MEVTGRTKTLGCAATAFTLEYQYDKAALDAVYVEN